MKVILQGVKPEELEQITAVLERMRDVRIQANHQNHVSGQPASVHSAQALQSVEDLSISVGLAAMNTLTMATGILEDLTQAVSTEEDNKRVQLASERIGSGAMAEKLSATGDTLRLTLERLTEVSRRLFTSRNGCEART